MAYGDIHNNSGTICRARKTACPLGEDGHSKDTDSFVAYHIENSGVDGDQVKGMIADGTPPGDAVAVAKMGLSASGSTASNAESETEVPRWKRGMIEDVFEHGNYEKFRSDKNIQKLTTDEWKTLAAEQEAKVNAATAELNAAEEASGYGRNDPGELDFNEFAAGGTFDTLKTRIDNLKKVHEAEPLSEYKRMVYEEAVSRLGRLEKVVKPGEEESFWRKRNAEFQKADAIDDRRSIEQERLDFLKITAERSEALN